MSATMLLVTLAGPAREKVESVLGGAGAELAVVRDEAAAARALGDHQLVILDAPDQASLVRLCGALRKGLPGSRPLLLAISQTPEIEARVQLLEAGADDVLVHPFDPRELEALVDALLLRTGATYQPAEAGPPEPAAADDGDGRQLIVFAAAKGGVGTTSLAVNSAVVLAEHLPRRVALVDLDLHHGQVSTHLDVRPSATTAEIALDEQLLGDRQALHAAGARHASGLQVYGAPARPDLGASVQARQALALTEALGHLFDLVVVDAGSVLDWRSLALIAAADQLVMPLTPEIPSLRLVQGALEVLPEGVAGSERTLFVLNNTFPRQTVTSEQIQDHLGVKLALEVPYDGEAYLNAANEGRPLVVSAPKSVAAQSVRRLAELLRGVEPESATPAARKGRLGGLLKRP